MPPHYFRLEYLNQGLEKEIKLQTQQLTDANGRLEHDREIAITDSDFAKLRRFFKETGLPTVASYFVLGPAWAVVTFMVSRALKSDDKKTRDKVVRELEEELKLTREKIEDSRSDGNKQAKYALMRLESKLEKQIAEVKYGLR